MAALDCLPRFCFPSYTFVPEHGSGLDAALPYTFVPEHGSGLDAALLYTFVPEHGSGLDAALQGRCMPLLCIPLTNLHAVAEPDGLLDHDPHSFQ